MKHCTVACDVTDRGPDREKWVSAAEIWSVLLGAQSSSIQISRLSPLSPISNCNISRASPPDHRHNSRGREGSLPGVTIMVRACVCACARARVCVCLRYVRSIILSLQTTGDQGRGGRGGNHEVESYNDIIN